MKIVQFTKSGSSAVQVGVLQGDNVVDISHLVPSSMALISGGEKMEGMVDEYLETNPDTLLLSQIKLQAPVTGMDKVLCIGMNYKDHCAEQNAPIPTEPVVFNKFPSCVVGPYSDIPFPPSTHQLDWEVELVIVIGKSAFQVKEENSMDYVYGFTVANDLSARDWQLTRNGGQWLVGKAMDCFAPIGPAIVTRKCLPDPSNLNLYCKLNNSMKQNSRTTEMVFNVPQIVSWVSKFFTLLPGDLILTGTPPGVGVFKNPQEFIQKGDTVICGIEHIGEIENKIV